MKKEEKKVPQLRFPKFKGDWEQRKLGELGEISTGSTPSTANSAYYSVHEPTGKPVGLIFKINLIGTTCKTDRISLALSE